MPTMDGVAASKGRTGPEREPSAPGLSSPRAEDAGRHWFPDFCRLPTVFAVMVAAELVVLIIALSPSAVPRDTYAFISTVSFLVQWIAVMCAALLCTLRPWLSRWPVWAGLTFAYAAILTVCAAGSWMAGWVDRSLGLGFSAGLPSIAELILGNLAVCALVAAAALRYFYIQHRWRRDIEARAEAQLRALQARIRPHFLFNSMNTIASLIRSSPKRAERAVEDLSELFRAVLKPGSSWCSLDDEISLCRRYLDLEQLRLGDRLRVEWALEALPPEARLPALTLQPLVENAIYHGIQHLPEGGEICIGGRSEGDRVSLWVENPVPKRAPRTRDRGHGIALDNIRARLEQGFGGRATMDMDKGGEHFRVSLWIPVETA